jgi:hypothetical protein
MTAILKLMIKGYGYPVDDADPHALTFAQAISTLGEYSDESDVRAFILRCVRRGSREPNLTHIIAANLACCGFFKTIVTTNFDDLALAAFWQLPVNEIYQEPHVIYDPKTFRRSRIKLGEEVPVIIKAHGHHTQYGLGILEHQLAEFAPGVKRAMQWQQPPRLGYLVVGSSGSFADGVMEALKDRRLTRGKPVYWFFRGKFDPSALPLPLAALADVGDVRFVQCDDSDALFLRLWHHLDGTGGSDWLLDTSDLLTAASLSEQIDAAAGRADDVAWGFDASSRPGETPEEQRAALGIDVLIRSILPLLDAIDSWDRELLIYDCLPESQRNRSEHAARVQINGRECAEADALKRAVTSRLPWTRRNRTLLRLALHEATDPRLSYAVLRTIDQSRGSRPARDC